jgi:hypothetical protein
MDQNLPEVIENEEALDDILCRTRLELIEFSRSIKSPLLILGAGGKMGPTLAWLVKRAVDTAEVDVEVTAVDLFPNETTRHWLETHGVRTIKCDLMERENLQRLPASDNVIYMVGMKFGTTQNPAPTWAFNTIPPTNVSERFQDAKIVVFSSGNVYPLVAVEKGGSIETDALIPLGEYPNSCVARERIFEYFSQKNGTPMALIRLNYALDLRYGVLSDIAQKVYEGQEINVTMGYFNCIWQGDANEFFIRSLGLVSSPPAVFNLTSPRIFSVREVALRFGELMNRPPKIVGEEAETALLSNPTRIISKLGEPPTPIDMVIKWTAHWIMSSGRLLGKPTHFEEREGKY